jgi:hypothetical protein
MKRSPANAERCGTAEFQRRLRRHRLHVRDTAHAIRAKDFLLLGHGVIETLKAPFVNVKVLSIVIPGAVEEGLTFSLTTVEA